jgi:hypothetical protein
MERIVSMVIQQVIRQFINRGMAAGINRMTRGQADASPEQHANTGQNVQTGQTAGRVKGAMRLLRRFGRF